MNTLLWQTILLVYISERSHTGERKNKSQQDRDCPVSTKPIYCCDISSGSRAYLVIGMKTSCVALDITPLEILSCELTATFLFKYVGMLQTVFLKQMMQPVIFSNSHDQLLFPQLNIQCLFSLGGDM